ncbi:MAG: acetamidase/formamidase family protein [Gemmatimonadales bacterium]
MFYTNRFAPADLLGLLLCASLLQPAVTAAQQPGARPASRDAAGNWVLWRRNFGVDNPLRLRIESSGDSLLATAPNGLKVSGRVAGDRLVLNGKAADGRTDLRLDLRWQGDSLVGTNVAAGQSVPAWVVRERARPASAASRQLFRPTQFHRVFSAALPPALRIWPGDTVRTETVDAGGIDSTGTRRSPGGNPLTGPFWIEGALPGDALVVHLLRIRTNRKEAASGAGLAFSAVEPEDIMNYKEADDSNSTWVIDQAARVARLKTPGDALRSYTIPLKPMLGCVGVAPGFVGRTETRSSGAPGRFGGNMDYNRVVEGATLSFQVTQPGAFLFLGDGHAAQGDGELTGSGLETSMDVEFSVELIRNRNIGFPRIDDATHIGSIGIGGSIDHAFQVATSGLALWLQQDYKLTRSEAAMVMGTAAEYDIAEVVDGDYNVVARMPKAALRGISVRR